MSVRALWVLFNTRIVSPCKQSFCMLHDVHRACAPSRLVSAALWPRLYIIQIMPHGNKCLAIPLNLWDVGKQLAFEHLGSVWHICFSFSLVSWMALLYESCIDWARRRLVRMASNTSSP